MLGSFVCKSTSGTTERICSSKSATWNCSRRILRDAVQHHSKLLRGEGFWQVVECAVAHGFHGRFDGGEGRDEMTT